MRMRARFTCSISSSSRVEPIDRGVRQTLGFGAPRAPRSIGMVRRRGLRERRGRGRSNVLPHFLLPRQRPRPHGRRGGSDVPLSGVAASAVVEEIIAGNISAAQSVAVKSTPESASVGARISVGGWAMPGTDAAPSDAWLADRQASRRRRARQQRRSWLLGGPADGDRCDHVAWRGLAVELKSTNGRRGNSCGRKHYRPIESRPSSAAVNPPASSMWRTGRTWPAIGLDRRLRRLTPRRPAVHCPDRK